MSETAIEWATHVWNPTTGCDMVSPGCGLPRPDTADEATGQTGGCYAMAMAKRLKAMGSAKYQNDGDPRTSGPGFGITVHPDTLDAPLHWRRPRTVFVNSMSDLFHAKVPHDFIAAVFAVMAATPQHTYQILTKRPLRMRRVLTDECQCGTGHPPGSHLRSAMEWAATPHNPSYVPGLRPGLIYRMEWPLPNVWIGASVEDQERADERIPHLLATPAAVRFLSCEPLLGPVDLHAHDDGMHHWLPDPPEYDDGQPVCQAHGVERCRQGCPFIDWVICGGESGPRARPMDPAWAASLVRQCQDAGVPAFMKQMGSVWAAEHGADPKGGHPEHWPAGLRVREMPQAVGR